MYVSYQPQITKFCKHSETSTHNRLYQHYKQCVLYLPPRYSSPEAVSPLALDWPVPTVQRLWFGSGLEDKQRRLRAFLCVMGADNPLMLQTSHVPQHLLLMATVLRSAGAV